jgi:hypothetical protein
MPKPNQFFIAYYRNALDEIDAELYVGITGSNQEFIKYFKMANDLKLSVDDITGIYPIDEELGIDGKEYKIGIIK